MRLALILICCCASSLAWLAPERCKQGKRRRRLTYQREVYTVPNKGLSVQEIAALQQGHLEQTYKNHTFTGVPIRATCEPNKIETYAAFNCKFYTYAPRLLASVACQSGCKLSHTVSTVDSYTASEGYNWGVKVSGKAKLGDIFEVGGEASTGGTYSCSYTKGRTTSDTVECSGSSLNGNLQLYNVQSDMECDFGTMTMYQEARNKVYGAVADNFFTQADLREIRDHAASFFQCRFPANVMIDTNKISDRMLEKVMTAFPDYNPYTDILTLEDDFVFVSYYKMHASVYEYKKLIPFTNEGGDSVYQYACIYNAA